MEKCPTPFATVCSPSSMLVSSIRTRTSSPRPGVEDAGRHPGLSLLHRAGPFGRHAAASRSKSRASTPRRKSAGWSSASARSKHDPVQLAHRDVPASSSASRTKLNSRPTNWEALYDTAAAQDGRARLGAAGPEAKQARSGVSDQRLRRPARRLRHEASTSPACGPTTWCFTSAKPDVRERLEKATGIDVRDAAIAAAGDRRAVQALHGTTALGPARFRCRPTSRRRRSALPGADTALSASLRDERCKLSRSAQQRDSRQLRLLDAGRVLRRVQAAVRSDDRRQSGGLPQAACIKGRTCTTAASR